MSLITNLEKEFLPLFDKLKSRLQKEQPTISFTVINNAVGHSTDFDGHMLGLKCHFPNNPLNDFSSIVLSINLCHLKTNPKFMADVTWEEGKIEASLNDEWQDSKDWLLVNDETHTLLSQEFPRLIKAFNSAIVRACS